MIMNLDVRYNFKPQKRTRALGIRLTPEELNRYNLMAAKLGHPLAQVIRALCEAQCSALLIEEDSQDA